MEKINNMEEADNFFRRNHSDNVICVKDGIEKEVDCYPEAKKFFDKMKMKEYQITYKFSDVIETIECKNSDEALEKANEKLISDFNPQIDSQCYDVEIEEIN